LHKFAVRFNDGLLIAAIVYDGYKD